MTKKRYLLKDLVVDRVDLVDRGANPDADIVIAKNYDEMRDRVIKNMKEGYPDDTQLKNGAAHNASFKMKRKKKKDKGAKGSAFPERVAAESSHGEAAPLAKHGSHNQKDHGNRGGVRNPMSNNKTKSQASNNPKKPKVHDQKVHGRFKEIHGVDVSRVFDTDNEAAAYAHTAKPGTIVGSRETYAVFETAREEAKKKRDAADIEARRERFGNESAEALKMTRSKGSRGKYESDHWKGVMEARRKRDKKIEKHGTHDQKSHGRRNGAGRSSNKEGYERLAHASMLWREAKGNSAKYHELLSSKPFGGSKIDSAVPASESKAPERRPLSKIAAEIRRDWGSKTNYAAKPYLDAMGALDSIHDNYYYDSGKSVVAYFLANAGTWRGDTARRVKAELKDMLKDKPIRKNFLARGPQPQPTNVGSAVPAGTPEPGKPAVGPSAPAGAPSGGLALSPNGPGPAAGPGSAPGKRPIEAPKADEPPKSKKKDDKKKSSPAKMKLAEAMAQRGKAPSVPPQPNSLERG